MAPFVESLAFLKTQTGFAIYGMIAFMAGAASAWIVIRWRIQSLENFAMWLLDWVGKLLGPKPGMRRLLIVIFCFNVTAMFLYMCTGVWVVLPALVSFMTGMNLAVIFVRGTPTWGLGEEEEAPDEDAAVSVSEVDGLAEIAEPPPLKILPLLCGLLVIVLELPAFWYSLGMGISLGHYVREHFTLVQILLFNYGETGILPAMAERCAAFVRVIVPVLAVSALAEAYAVAESTKLAERTHGKDRPHDKDRRPGR